MVHKIKSSKKVESTSYLIGKESTKRLNRIFGQSLLDIRQIPRFTYSFLVEMQNKRDLLWNELEGSRYLLTILALVAVEFNVKKKSKIAECEFLLEHKEDIDYLLEYAESTNTYISLPDLNPLYDISLNTLDQIVSIVIQTLTEIYHTPDILSDKLIPFLYKSWLRWEATLECMPWELLSNNEVLDDLCCVMNQVLVEGEVAPGLMLDYLDRIILVSAELTNLVNETVLQEKSSAKQ